MSLREIRKPESILMAVEEFDLLGRKEFLKKYGFGKAREYYLFRNGKYYDSKAIIGAAHGYEYPQNGPLKFNQFTGGEKTVRKKLETLGFMVRINSEEPLVLTENEATFDSLYDHWEDVTGERYHFPNLYKALIVPGRSFVYYHGSRKKDGKRQTPEYFGYGKIGEIWPDPKNSMVPKKNWKWFCSIDDYLPFKNSVPFKINGKNIEDIPKSQFRSAVRILSKESLEKILKLGDLRLRNLEQDTALPNFLRPSEVKPQMVGKNENLLKPNLAIEKKGTFGGRSSVRRSKHSHLIGEWAEEVVFNELQSSKGKMGYKEISNVSKDNLGWDIQYRDVDNNLYFIEVKGTQGLLFLNIEITGNEWEKAEEYGKNYFLYLVSNCGNKYPKIQIIRDPYKAYLKGTLSAIPTSWRIELVGSEQL